MQEPQKLRAGEEIMVEIDVAVSAFCAEDPTGLIEWNFQGGAKELRGLALHHHVTRWVRSSRNTSRTQGYNQISLKLCNQAVRQWR